ncbi:MAG TPA: NAD(P)-dependent oxidoreductase [Myxococcota bacterium]
MTGSILITGAGGFLGTPLVHRLGEEGRRTLALGRGLEPAAQGSVRRIAGGVGDAADLRRLLDEEAVTAVVHLSAHPDAPLAQARRIFEANLGGTLRVLSAAREARRPPHVVLASSIKVYGRAAEMPLRESTPEAPTSAYAVAKAAADRIGLLFHEQAGVPVTVLRLSQVYGPGQPPGMLVQQLVEAARSGKTLDMTSGEQTRDLLFVDDAVDAFVRALDRPERAGRVLNVGTGVETRLCDLAQRFHELVPSAPRPRIGAIPYRDGELWRQVVDPATARTELGFTARVALDEGLRRTLEAALRTEAPGDG